MVVRAQANTAVAVRLFLLDLETSIGIADLSEAERNVLAALILCGGVGGIVAPGVLRQHPLAAGLTHPTYHRVLRSLLERGMAVYQSEQSGERGYALAAEFPPVAAVAQDRSA